MTIFGRSLGRSLGRLASWSVGQSVGRLVGWLVGWWLFVVVLFNQRRTDAHTTLMAGELEELPKLLRRVYKATKGQYLSTDSEGFFLRAS